MLWTYVNAGMFLLVVLCAAGLFGQVVYRRYKYVQLGQPEAVLPEWAARVRELARHVLQHRKLLQDRKSGLMHLVIFYGFIVLQFGAIDLIVTGLANGKEVLFSQFPLFTLLQEATVAVVLLATGYAAYRRYWERLARLNKGWKPSIVLYFIAALMLTVLLSLAFHRLWQEEAAALSAPLSSLIASCFSGIPAKAAGALFYVCWWAHLLILLAFLVYIPQSKHFHLLTAPLNLFLARKVPLGRLTALDLEDEEAETFGAGQIEHFSRKQMLDLYACVECGRCTNVCPASNTGKALSPMHLIVKLRDHLTEKGAAVTSRSPWVPAALFAAQAGRAHAMPSQGGLPNWHQRFSKQLTDIAPTMAWQKSQWQLSGKSPLDIELIGDVMTEDELWSCTTCRNCEDQCPVGNEHVDKIIDMRRHLVLMRGELPAEGQRALQNIERQSNPWGMSRQDRAAWTAELEGVTAPTVKENPQFEWLFFVGSMGSYDLRARRVTKALVRLLHEAGVSFAILGNEERNSGDTPRRMGNELLFQQLCADNIALFRKYGVKRIVTACPHTFHSLSKEYPAFGMEGIEVVHHTQLLEELVQAGRLKAVHPVEERIVYHDSCYLGRYNGVYDAPRNVLKAMPGAQLVEMERSRENGMCCGAGGGMMWLEEKAGARVNLARTEQALAQRPTVIGSACPYCLTMMDDGTKQLNAAEAVQVCDVAELLERAVFGGPA
ncbi:(Fe-S)-binding protein [Paenibacillus sp. GCM10027626]|uniref:(Fe-S)-binding protein n=1 Tax=Paenibacillus sp. GCM10027626 TaxID=3273411 RepID=UPI0036413303